MSDWKPSLYLKFEKERTQPAIDLVMKIEHENPVRIVDIGCGPGNSTSVLKARWNNSEIIGVDSSPAMIEQAQKTGENIDWVCADASSDLSNLGKFDIVFSNAAIQWIPNHEKLLSNLFELLNPNGILAVQVPDTTNMPFHTELKRFITTDEWKKFFVSLSNVYSANGYRHFYDILSDLSSHIEMWVTDYCHILNTHNEIVKWVSAAALRPYINCFNDERMKDKFLLEYENYLSKVYPKQRNNKIMFPFTRVFFIAKRGPL